MKLSYDVDRPILRHGMLRIPLDAYPPLPLRTGQRELAVRIEINGEMFPVERHPAMLHDLMRRWVERVRPPLRLVAGEARPMALGPHDDPYLLQPPGESPVSG